MELNDKMFPEQIKVKFSNGLSDDFSFPSVNKDFLIQEYLRIMIYISEL